MLNLVYDRAADGTSTAIDHGVLAFEQHTQSSPVPKYSARTGASNTGARRVLALRGLRAVRSASLPRSHCVHEPSFTTKASRYLRPLRTGRRRAGVHGLRPRVRSRGEAARRTA